MSLVSAAAVSAAAVAAAAAANLRLGVSHPPHKMQTRGLAVITRAAHIYLRVMCIIGQEPVLSSSPWCGDRMEGVSTPRRLHRDDHVDSRLSS